MAKIRSCFAQPRAAFKVQGRGHVHEPVAGFFELGEIHYIRISCWSPLWGQVATGRNAAAAGRGHQGIMGFKRSRDERREFFRLRVTLAPLPEGVQSAASQVAVDECRELRLRHRADLGRLHVAVLEQHQRRNAADAVLRRRGWFSSMLSLATLSLPPYSFGDLLEHRGNHLARPAPLGPVVDQHRTAAFQYLLFETCRR